MPVDPVPLDDLIVYDDGAKTAFVFMGRAKGCKDLILRIAADLDLTLPEGGGAGGGGAIVLNSVPTPAPNSSATVFTVAADFSQVAVYLNGLRQKPSLDYTVSGANTFTMTAAPLTGDTLMVDYVPATSPT